MTLDDLLLQLWNLMGLYLRGLKPSPPPTPTNLAASAGNTQITLTWTDNSGVGLETSETLQRALDSGFTTGLTSFSLAAATVRYIDTGLTNGTTYYYRVRSVAPTGVSAWSNTASTSPFLNTGSTYALMTNAEFTAVQAKQSGNTTQWQNFKAKLDSNLSTLVNVAIGNYQASSLEIGADYALGWLLTGNTDYASKAVAMLRSVLYGYGAMPNGSATRLFLAIGDNSTVTFTLPQTPNPTGSLGVYLATVTNYAQVRSSTASYDRTGHHYGFIKTVSSSPSGGGTVYIQGVDWNQSDTVFEDSIDWSLGGTVPANGATYYFNFINRFSATKQAAAAFSLTGNQITFTTAPTTGQAVLVEYIYTDGAGLLWQQTKDNDTGFQTAGYNNIFQDSGYGTRYLAYAALIRDWLSGYSGLTSTDIVRCEDLLNRWSNHAAVDAGVSAISGVYKANAPASNYCAGHYFLRAVAAAVLRKNGNTNGAARVTDVTNWRTTYLLPYFSGTNTDITVGVNAGGNDGEGFRAEGWNYGGPALASLVRGERALFADADIADQSAGQTWATNAGNALVHHQFSTTTLTVAGVRYAGKVNDLGDGYSYPEPYVAFSEVALLSAHAGSSTTQGLMNYALQNYTADFGGGIGLKGYNHTDLIWRDPSASTVNPNTLTALAYKSSGQGVVVGRKDWTYTDVWFTFGCGNLVLGASHQRFNQGHLEVWRGPDPLLAYGVAIAGAQVYTQSNNGGSTWSNLVLLDDNGEGVDDYRWCQGQNYGTTGCSLLQQEDTGSGGYSYMVGDYANAYSKSTVPGNKGVVSVLQRSVVYLRTPGYFFVYDRLTTKHSGTNPEYPKRFQWMTYSSTPTLVSGGPAWTYTGGSSVVFVTPVSSKSIQTAIDNPSINGNKNTWRVITNNTSATDTINICSAIQVAANSVGTQDAVTRITGSLLEGAIQGDYVTMFGIAAGPVTTPTSYSYTGVNTHTIHHTVCDLTPSQTYTLSGAASGTQVASAVGVITFTTTGSGSSQTVTIT
jgi:hypothetical protein